MGSLFGRPSAAAIRHDPNRPKTPEDLKRIEAARLKREKRAARKAKSIDKNAC